MRCLKPAAKVCYFLLLMTELPGCRSSQTKVNPVIPPYIMPEMPNENIKIQVEACSNLKE